LAGRSRLHHRRRGMIVLSHREFTNGVSQRS
jgi:hypothetical protein